MVEVSPDHAVIVVEGYIVRPERIIANVRVTHARFAITTPQLLEEVLKRYPRLMQHACINDVGPTFAAVADHTSLPHLLEHMVIEDQVAHHAEVGIPDELAEQGVTSGKFLGATRWTDRDALTARVEVSYLDDRAALRAFRDAIRCLNCILLA
ncbi:Uncharacterised protein [Slackia heliotrinireducens]|jgi:hypothetical protein|uniref:Cyanophycin synthase-like N-terminal domain-containing protein n=1 Tax=Slackia heliotrinireducens (strain ATCC 29202 / DSM 20476 / NCTC 11029 / RHS 1) TaxID=471855 RepID=C7N3A5_SLAHD|nr:hypothetical protein [Slackia heliotrinireducens]ACV23628.1 hypothetical protein Shel_26250 [Slackia heliotrinireducens DSM 20476]VEH03122.1 Uncharacterised protein [Slackia heliotrinireducens]